MLLAWLRFILTVFLVLAHLETGQHHVIDVYGHISARSDAQAAA